MVKIWSTPLINIGKPRVQRIDVDSSAAKRSTILANIKKKFGERQVLNIATFGTEKSKSAIQAASRGLGISVDDARQMSGLIPQERGQLWSLKDCFEGNEEKGRKPVTELVNLAKKYDRLKETAMRIEGVINKSSVHASGVYIYNSDYWNYNALMKAPSGQPTTQFDQDDSDYLGGLKADLLTVEAVDMLQTCMETLVKDGHMESKGSLRETYNTYLHPDVLDMKDPEVWGKIGRGEISALFQLETAVNGF